VKVDLVPLSIMAVARSVDVSEGLGRYEHRVVRERAAATISKNDQQTCVCDVRSPGRLL
jgi:hypothetical protein